MTPLLAILQISTKSTEVRFREQQHGGIYTVKWSLFSPDQKNTSRLVSDIQNSALRDCGGRGGPQAGYWSHKCDFCGHIEMHREEAPSYATPVIIRIYPHLAGVQTGKKQTIQIIQANCYTGTQTRRASLR